MRGNPCACEGERVRVRVRVRERERERERQREREESEAILQPDVNGGNTSKANFNKVVNSISGGVKNKYDFPK